MKFSVIVPNWNHGAFLDECLTSIKNQDYEDWEVIVYDNVSTDNSEEVVAKYLVDPRIKWIQSDIHQWTAAFSVNKAMKVVTGDAAMVLNADDYLLDKCFSTLEPYFVDPKVGLVSTGVLIYHEDGRTEIFAPQKINRGRLGDSIFNNPIYPASPFRPKLFYDVGEYDVTMTFYDWDFWVRCLIKGCGVLDWDFRLCPTPLMARRIHGSRDGAELAGDEVKLTGARRIVQKYVRAAMPVGGVKIQ